MNQEARSDAPCTANAGTTSPPPLDTTAMPADERLPMLRRGEVRVTQYLHPADFSMAPHVHPFHEIGYIIAGQGWYDTSAGTTKVERGCLLLWSGRVPHRAVDQPGSPLHQIIIMIDDAVLTGRSFQPCLAGLFSHGEPIILPANRVGPALETLVRRISAEGRRQLLGQADMLAAMTVELCVATCRRISKSELVDPDALEHADPRVEAVLHDIDSRYYHALGPEQYARDLGISVRRFTELFRLATGRTFTEQLTAVRIGHACELLLATTDRIINIAFEVGYNNISYFNRSFRRLIGQTPQEYRRNQHLQT
jgi:AraC-like DNA-binding protein/quercetin dioxygenase-like cupin family protein